MTAAFVLATILSQGPQEVLDKIHARVEQNPSFHAEFRVKLQNIQFRAVNDLKRPLQQRILVDDGRSEEIFVQTPTSEVVFSTKDKTYYEYSPFSDYAEPPDIGVLPYGRPVILASKEPEFRAGRYWKDGGTVGGVHTLTREFKTPTSEVLLEIKADEEGRLLYFHDKVVSPDSNLNVEYTLVSDDITDKGHVVITDELIPGYVPAHFRKEVDTPHTPQAWKWPDLVDVRTNQPAHPDSNLNGKPFVLLFTSPDCEPSRRGEAAFADLQKTLSKEGSSLTQISMTSVKPDLTGIASDRPVYYDPSGVGSLNLSIPMTPYLLVVDKTGRICQGWAGYGDDERQHMMDTILAAVRASQ